MEGRAKHERGCRDRRVEKERRECMADLYLALTRSGQ